MIKDQISINIPFTDSDSILFAIESCINQNLYKGKILSSSHHNLPTVSLFLHMLPYDNEYFLLLKKIHGLNFDFVAPIYHISHNSHHIYILFKFIPNTLESFSKSFSNKTFNEKIEFCFFLNKQLLDISSKLYENNLIFFKFHPKNILIDFFNDDYKIFLIDFTFCTEFHQEFSDEKFLLLFDSNYDLFIHPSTFIENKLLHYIDYYSIACTIFKLLYNHDYHDINKINYCFNNNNVEHIYDIFKFDYRLNFNTFNHLYTEGIYELEIDNRNLIALMKIILSKYFNKVFNPFDSKLLLWDLLEYLDKVPKYLHLPTS
jgi:hypothetical protein